MTGKLACRRAPTIHGSVYGRPRSGKHLKRLSPMLDSTMPIRHHVDAATRPAYTSHPFLMT